MADEEGGGGGGGGKKKLIIIIVAVVFCLIAIVAVPPHGQRKKRQECHPEEEILATFSPLGQLQFQPTDLHEEEMANFGVVEIKTSSYIRIG